MSLLKFSNGRFLPALEEVLREVTLDEWRANPQAHTDATALVIDNNADIVSAADDVSGFDTVILAFPAFTDGRAYSQARLLRERLNFSGELRARGEVLRDQIHFMVRCGFDAFETTGVDARASESALREFSVFYQAAADSVTPVWRTRTRGAAAA